MRLQQLYLACKATETKRTCAHTPCVLLQIDRRGRGENNWLHWLYKLQCVYIDGAVGSLVCQVTSNFTCQNVHGKPELKRIKVSFLTQLLT